MCFHKGARVVFALLWHCDNKHFTPCTCEHGSGAQVWMLVEVDECYYIHLIKVAKQEKWLVATLWTDTVGVLSGSTCFYTILSCCVYTGEGGVPKRPQGKWCWDVCASVSLLYVCVCPRAREQELRAERERWGALKKGNHEWTEKRPTGKTICPVANHAPRRGSHSI